MVVVEVDALALALALAGRAVTARVVAGGLRVPGGYSKGSL